MDFTRLPVFTAIITALLLLPPSAAAEGLAGHHYKVQFKQWYQQYGFIFAKLLAQNCSLEYTAYLYNTPSNATIDWDGGGDQHNTLTQPVVGCLLEATPQFVMSSTQSAQVLLGLTPTILAILAILGASTDESATLAVVGTRPLLSFLLACGSPSVYLSRAFEFKDPVEILSKHRPQRYRQGQGRGGRPHSPVFYALLLALQDAFALAATANIAVLNYELGVQAICGFASEWMLMPLLWSTSVLAIYLLGIVWHRLRVQRVVDPLAQNQDSSSSSSGKPASSWVQIIKRRVRGEFRLSLNNGEVKVVAAEEGKLHIVLGWILSVISILHIIFGTLTLSSLLFIGPRDALKLIARFVASGLVCRVITMYELAGLRERFVSSAGPIGGSAGGESSAVSRGSEIEKKKAAAGTESKMAGAVTVTSVCLAGGGGAVDMAAGGETRMPRSKTSFV